MGKLERKPGGPVRVYTTAYPDAATLVEWAQDQSWDKLGGRIGVSRGSLRDYLARRPELREEVQAALRKRLTDEQRAANRRAGDAAWQSANVERVRATRRKWARNQAPEKRQRWNEYNRRRRAGLKATRDSDTTAYVALVRRDPCAYCNGAGGTVDHIVPLALAGDDHWMNYAGACLSCNASKHDRPLLIFMLARACEADRKVA